MSESAAAAATASRSIPPAAVAPQPDVARRDSGSNSTSKNNASTSAASAAATVGEQKISYSAERVIGNGSFGVVFEARVVETDEIVAIKKVLQDKRFKNRELQIMRQLVKDPHPNIVALRHCFYSQV